MKKNYLMFKGRRYEVLNTRKICCKKSVALVKDVKTGEQKTIKLTGR